MIFDIFYTFSIVSLLFLVFGDNNKLTTMLINDNIVETIVSVFDNKNDEKTQVCFIINNSM